MDMLLLIVLILLGGGPCVDKNNEGGTGLLGANAQLMTGGGEDGILFNATVTAYTYVRDDITFAWTYTDTTYDAVQEYDDQILQFFTTHGPINGSLTGPNGKVLSTDQIPVAGCGVVLAYNVAGLAAGKSLVLNSTVLAMIWSGKTTVWNDTLIAALNPGSSLSGDITLVYSNDSDSIGSISSVFDSYLRSWGGGLNNNAGNTTNNGVSIQSIADRAAYVKGNVGAITYMSLAQATLYGVPFASMLRSGTLVRPSVSTVSTAMSDFAVEFNTYGGNRSLLIINNPTVSGWPISYLVYATIPIDFNLTSCIMANEFVIFVSWIVLNNQVTTLIESAMHTELPVSYRRAVLNNLQLIRCNNGRASTTSYIVGMGSPFNPYPTLGYYYTSSTFTLKYYTGNSATSLANFVDGTIDFGQTSAPIAQSTLNEIGDLITIPGYSYAIGPSYNVPELYQAGGLRMNWTTVADIYLGLITMWNDAAIAELNPEVASILPAKAIVLVYQSNNSSLTGTFNTAVSMKVPQYAAVFGNYSGFGGSPIVAAGKGVPVNGFGFPQALASTQYGFGLCISQEISNNVKGVMLPNAAGNYLAPDNQGVLSTLQDNIESISSGANVYNFYFSPSAGSWPIVSINSMMLHQRSMSNPNAAAALVDWIYWMNTDPEGIQIFDASGYVAVYRVEGLMPTLLKKLANVTSQGIHVSSIYPCVNSDGILCSGYGNCTNGACACQAGRVGNQCQDVATKGGGDDTTLGLAVGLGVGLTALILVFCAVIVILAAVAIHMSRREREEEWLISKSEIELGDAIGIGGFGEVHKGMWKGTEVAVKLLPKKVIARDRRNAFVEEMHIMAKLRHPNVVLFMAACDDPSGMFIVMEWMALGSLFDLLHNDLVPDIPYQLQIKMLYQAAKGMHFLHSSGIVHRDLKSLNLLLDNKWNVKVADFGLTKLKDSVTKMKRADEVVGGSVRWMSPEALNAAGADDDGGEQIDYTRSDVYSFGVIMWEMMTREMPYDGWSTAQVAVVVLRDDVRPCFNSNMVQEYPQHKDYIAFMEECWARDATMRPVFLDTMQFLQGQSRDGQGLGSSGAGSSGGDPHASTSSSIATATGVKPYQPYSRTKATSSIALTSMASDDVGPSHASSGTLDEGTNDRIPAHQVKAPRENVTFVVCDLARFNEVWQEEPDKADHAIREYIKIVRKSAADRSGYVFSNAEYHSGGTAMVAFPRAFLATRFALAVQAEVSSRSWPVNGRMVSSRVSVHHAKGRCPAPRKRFSNGEDYEKEAYGEACRLNVLCPYGCVTGSSELANTFTTDKTEHDSLVYNSGQSGHDVDMIPRTSNDGRDYVVLVTEPDRDRVTGILAGIDRDNDDDDHDDHDRHGKSPVPDTTRMSVDEELGLCSSNACQWIIKHENIALDGVIGEGVYGSVSRGTYNGREVAVKRLVVSGRLGDDALRNMRREAAVLSRLDHPNIVKMLGMVISNGERLIVMELVERGSLSDILLDRSIKLSWKTRTAMLGKAAIGIKYLHDRNIIHRDIKSSNLLVGEHWNVKVGDFGFATIIEEQATMTRCGTPAWSAPEVLLHKRYNEKADVYSFGIVMWEVLARDVPYKNSNPFNLGVDVINGKRPDIPSDADEAFANFMTRCWSAKAKHRPSMDDVITFLSSYANIDV